MKLLVTIGKKLTLHFGGVPASRIRTAGFDPRDGRSRAGSVLVEATFVSVILFGLIWLAWSLCWALFAKSRMQMAVRSGRSNRGNRTTPIGRHGSQAHHRPGGRKHRAGVPVAPSCLSDSEHKLLRSERELPSPLRSTSGVVTVSVQNYPYALIAPIFAIGKGASNTQVSGGRDGRRFDMGKCIPGLAGLRPPQLSTRRKLAAGHLSLRGARIHA